MRPSQPSSPATGQPSAAAILCLGGALVAAGLAAYANSLGGPFILDDLASIRDNPSIRHLLPLQSALWAPAHTGSAGRPVLNLSYALNYAAGGLDVRGYHAANLAIHLLAGLVLFGIVRRTPGAGTWPAFAAALVWIVHPLQTEAVTYVSERAESLMGLFYLLTVYGFARAARAPAEVPQGGSKAGLWLWLSAIACLLGMGTKEVMVTAPVVVFLYDRTFVAGTFRRALQLRWRYYAGLVSPWILLGFLLSGVGERGVGINLGGSWWTYALMECRIVLRYLGLALWPHPLVFDYGTGDWHPGWSVAPSVVGVALLAAGTAWALFSPAGRPARRAIGFAGAWVLLVLAPTSSIVAIMGQPMAEHRMYLPLAGVAAAAAAGLDRLWGRRSVVAWIVVAAALGWMTHLRNETYRSPEALWRDAVVHCPGSDRARNNLGSLIADTPGRLDEAIALYREALRLNPLNAEAHNNLGLALARTPGGQDEAIAHYREALRIKPDFQEAHNNLGFALATAPGGSREAVAELERAIHLRPDSAEARNNLGFALTMIPGRVDEAIASFREALRLKPDYPEARNNLGFALSMEPGRAQEAVAELRQALRLRPGYAEAQSNLGSALMLIPGRQDDAIAEYREALRLDPGLASAHDNLGLALARMPGRTAEAEAEFQEAVRLQPANAEARLNLGSALFAQGRAPEAADQYREALRLQPGYAEAHLNLGNILLTGGDTAGAADEYREALSLRPDYTEARYGLGLALAKTPGHEGEAVLALSEVVRLRPGNAEARYGLGVALDAAGRGAEAIPHYEEAVRLKPGYAEALFNLANDLGSEGRTAEAVSRYEDTIRARPGFAQAHHNLANTLARAGRLPESIAHYEEALQLNPGAAATHIGLAAALLRVPGRQEDAVRHLREALRLDPGNAMVRGALARLASGRP